MNAQENNDFIRDYFKTISGKPKPPELMNQYVAEQPLKDQIALYEAALLAYELRGEQMIAEDELESVIGRASGRHKGAFTGMPPTGKSWDVPIHLTYRVNDGKIVEPGASDGLQEGIDPQIQRISGTSTTTQTLTLQCTASDGWWSGWALNIQAASLMWIQGAP